MRKRTCLLVFNLVCILPAYGESRIVYSIRTGGDNHCAQYETGGEPAFTNTSTGVARVGNDINSNLTWQVGVTVGGLHQGAPGDGVPPIGAVRNLVFDLQVLMPDHVTLANLGAATIVCTGGTPGSSTAVRNCHPTTAGFWSQINDGDADPSGVKLDKFANAALARGIGNNGALLTRNLEDDAAALVSGSDPGGGGPNFDYGWYPAAMGKGGLDFACTKTIDTSSPAIWSTALAGKLVGFGAGYKSYDYANYRFGVGMGLYGCGFGAGNEDDPVNPIAPERPLFEGQINCNGLVPGTYWLRVIPSPDGNNILHGQVDYSSTTPNYGGFGTFAAKANQVGGVVGGQFTPYAEVPFVVSSCDLCIHLQRRSIFYNNSYYDGNNAGINTGISATNNRDDDSDAIDTSKYPLMPGAGSATFANWTGFAQGINGLIYDVDFPTRRPVVGDFTFKDIGRWGTAPGTLVTPNGFKTFLLSQNPQVTRCVITFASTGGSLPTGSIRNTWLQVTIGTGFGLPAAETHWWGNAVGDDGPYSGFPIILVNATDEVDARNHPYGLANRAPVWCPWDYNKDGLVNATDEIIVRNNPASLITGVRRIVR